MQRGRPLLIGNDIEEKVRKYIMTLRNKGVQVTFSIAIAVAKTLIEQGDSKSLKVLKFKKDWIQSLLRQIGFKKLCCNKRKSNYTWGCTGRSWITYLHDIVTKI